MSSQAQIPAFLTAFDPTDLPGGSVDPLGFEPGYLWLADRILPGLTVAGGAPRYISALCAGIALADTTKAATPRDATRLRQDCQQRFERLWVVANTLASDTNDIPTDGLRGVTYARKAIDAHQGRKTLDADGYSSSPHSDRTAPSASTRLCPLACGSSSAGHFA